MITISITGDTPQREVEEFIALFSGAVPASIYDDVDQLQQKVAAIETTITGLLSTASANLNDKDLNKCVGKIIIGYGNNCLNRPNNANGYLINIPHNSAPDKFNMQIWYCRPSTAIFIRNMDNGTFGDWSRVF